MFRNILVPLDGSPIAETALEVAGGLAQALRSQVHLVRCLPDSVSADFSASADDFHEFCLYEEKEARKYLSVISARLSALGLQVQCHVLSGAAAGQIAQMAAQKGIDLIVLTSHGRSGISRMMLGSVAETLARCAPCPVMIIRWKPEKV